MPNDVDILLKHLKARTERKKRLIEAAARRFFHTLGLMNVRERQIVGTILCRSCPHDFPNNAHIELDLLERIIGIPAKEIKKYLNKLKCLGFEISYTHNVDDNTRKKSYTIYLEWKLWNEDFNNNIAAINHGLNFTDVAIGVVETIGKNYCFEHTIQSLVNVNFSALSSETIIPDIHPH